MLLNIQKKILKSIEIKYIMLRKNVNKILVVIVLNILVSLCIGYYLNGQRKKDDLENKRNKIIQEIEYSTKLLKSTSDKRGKTVQRLRLIDKKLSKRNELISLYKHQLDRIDIEITEKEKKIERLNVDLKHHNKLYAEFIYYAYKNNNEYNSIIFLIASKTLNQFYLRKKYLEQLREARLKKMNLVKSIKLRIDLEVNTLIKDKERKRNALIALSEEQRNLKIEKEERKSRAEELKKEERSLRNEIKEKKKIEREIERAIEAIISEEAKKNKFIALTPEQKLISNDFEKNKGRLPWPTRQGIITQKFGKHRHPVIKSFETFNSGVDISTIQNEYIRVIFSGTVSKIFSIKGANYTVIVRHGAYYSVYHNLIDIKVNVGDELRTKDIIGRVSTRNQDNSSIVHLEIWKGLEKLNPEEWISN
jgi:septal ring factor EnvC (AmiA/AmiB activator)